MFKTYDDFLNELKIFGCHKDTSQKTHCIPFGDVKKAALLFDRIYVDSWDYFCHLQMIGWSPGDEWKDHGNLPSNILPYSKIPHPSMVFVNPSLSADITSRLDYGPRGMAIPTNYDEIYKRVVTELFNQKKLAAVPFISGSSYKKDDEVDVVSAWHIIYEGINEPITSNISWQQAMEFRKDKTSKEDYRNIRKLHLRLLGLDSIIQAQDEVGLAIEKYELACKKHGFSLVKSTLNLVYNKQSVLSAMLTGAATGSITASIIAGGLCISSQTALNIAEHKINKKDLLLSENSEAALLSKIRKI